MGIHVAPVLAYDDEHSGRAGLVALCRDFDVCPHLLSADAVRACFRAATAHARAENYGLPYAQFLDVVALMAKAAFSGDRWGDAYATDAAKLAALLERWGLADPVRLELLKGRT